MKKIVLLFFLVTISIANSAFAALPPLYESIRVIKAILDSPNLQQQIGPGKEITSILRNDFSNNVSSFRVTTPSCYLDAEVKYQPAHMPGLRSFDLVFGNLMCDHNN